MECERIHKKSEHALYIEYLKLICRMFLADLVHRDPFRDRQLREIWRRKNKGSLEDFENKEHLKIEERRVTITSSERKMGIFELLQLILETKGN